MDNIIGCKYCLTEITEYDRSAAFGYEEIIEEEFDFSEEFEFFHGASSDQHRSATKISIPEHAEFFFGFTCFNRFEWVMYMGDSGKELDADDVVLDGGVNFKYCPMCGRLLETEEHFKNSK